ncbi:MAG: PIN domain-containing protein [Candidatus Woykebacteria bacterium]
MKVFVDSDVVISSLLSQSGAAYILTNAKNLQLFISNIAYQELKIVTERLGIEKQKLDDLLRERFKTVELEENLSVIKGKYGNLVLDQNDAHILAGAKAESARFLVSYSTKHFKAEEIKRVFNIISLKPAFMLQYLRSLQK